MNAVDACSTRVKTTTETPREAVTTSARGVPVSRRVVTAAPARPAARPGSGNRPAGATTDSPTTTGSSGSTHGARVVRTPATSAPRSRTTAQTRAAISAPVSVPVQTPCFAPSAPIDTNVHCRVTP